MNIFLEEKSLKKLEDAVTEIEKSTDAEIVIAIGRFSGNYRDVSIIFGFILSMISLVFVIFSPLVIPPLLVLPFVIIFYFAGYLVCSKYELCRRLLTGENRRHDQVKKAAKIAFFEEHVSATKDRTGILFYISLFERQVEILTDLGIDGKISKDKWNSLNFELNKALRDKNSVEKFTETLLKCVEFLSLTFPAGEDNPDEIPNRPRIRE